MHKSPKYKSIDITTIKDRQKYFKNLYEEVNKSRMAVETITSFKNTELSFKKKIDQIQDDLHTTISRINMQSKKNVILTEVVNLMKGEMFNLQKTFKKEEETNDSKVQKKIKKVRYDIEQLLQKYNQEIAKINSLKQLANSGRSQRVVFSNLFKKIEKEIKQNEQIYKENLMKSQIAKDKCDSKYEGLTVHNEKDANPKQNQNQRYFKNIASISPVQNNFFSQSDQDPNFVIISKQKGFVGEKRKKHATKQSLHSQNYEMKNKSGEFYALISTYENFIDEVKVHMEFSDLHEGLSFYEGVEKANEELLFQVKSLEDKIDQYEKQIKAMKLQKQRSECFENQKQLPIKRSYRTPPNIQKIHQEQVDSQNQTQILEEISLILNFALRKQKFDDQNLRALDSKVDDIFEELKLNCQLKNDSKKPNRSSTANSEGNIVDILLDRMEKFNECEKILDKNLFKQEYVKELGRSKKFRCRK